MKFSKAICLGVLVVFSTSGVFAKKKPSATAWTNEAFKEMNALSKDVAKDLRVFFKENRDWVAENFGGTAYDRKEAFKTIIRDVKYAIDFGINGVKEFLGMNYKVMDGLQNLCHSPRTCLGIQYIVANSILENMPKYRELDFYFGSVNENHNFIVMIPKDIEKTQENIEKFSIIFDPYPSQSDQPDEFIHFGFESEYKGMALINFIDADSIKLMFGTNPFNLPPKPNPEPEPNPNPNPTPDPDPTPACSQVFEKDAAGNDTNVFANNVFFVLKGRCVLGVLEKVEILDVIPECEWMDPGNGVTIIDSLLAQISEPFNCMGISIIGKGGVLPAMSTRTIYNMGTGYIK